MPIRPYSEWQQRGDDSYWRKNYEFTIESYDEDLSVALKEFEWLKLAVTRLEEVSVTRTGIDYEKLCYAKDIDIQSRILDSLNHALAH